ncbi:MAG: hypothetical protein H6712_22805 [Myxococcales bacterium]|nr:hypothetical protein [Myxococcales bacterium]MCB9716706.1 hypothetical protein [Myxococcales bacterium]
MRYEAWVAATSSRDLAGWIGPTLVVLGLTEAWNLDAFESQIPPVVYLNGTIVFVVGLGIVRVHNRWQRGWPLLVTLVGWLAVLGGLVRMMFPEAPQAGPGTATYLLLAGLVVCGIVLTFAGYRPSSRR